MDLRDNNLEVETVPIRGYKCFEFKNPKTLGSYIQKLRVLKGLVQKELGARLDTDVSTIVAWENDYCIPCKGKLKKLISVLGADPVVLVQYEGVLNERRKKILKFIQDNPLSTQRACRDRGIGCCVP